MISLFLRRLPCFFLALLAMAAARGEHPVIARARAFVGSEAALQGVKSIHYVGSLITPDPADPKKMTYVTVDIIIQSPFQQRITASSDKSGEVTALDGYDAWHRVQDPKNSRSLRLQILGKDQIKRLRANTWENLAFYRGLEREGGKVLDLGTVTVDGIVCTKLAFVHDSKIVFYRSFDQATGRLVVTETEAGDAIREKGEFRTGGIRFPKAITTTTKDRAGQERSVTLTFDQITVNESFPAGIFAIPALSAKP